MSITLAGSPAEIGRLWGENNAPAIREDMQGHYLQPAAQAGLGRDELLRRSDKFLSLAQEFAPHWLEEGAAIAAAAGVDAQLYLAFVGSVYRGIWRGEECTSYAVSPDYTQEGRIFFHKNRDNVPRRQCAFLLAPGVPGVNKFIAVSDASVISCMMMVNERGLAGSADVGGLAEDRPRFRGWMNTALLRYIAERAADCAQALAIIEQFVGAGHYAGGDRWGTHWLFVDRHGMILEVSHNSSRVEHRYHRAKVYFSADRGEAVRRLQQAPEPIDFATFHNVSRDPSICFAQSISGMSVQISRDWPALLSAAWVTMPARSLAFPLLMGGERTPRVLLNGEVDRAGRESTGDVRRWEPIEAFAFTSQRLLEGQVRRLLAQGARGDSDGQSPACAELAEAQVGRPPEGRDRSPLAQARAAVDHWVATCTAAHLSALGAG